MDHFNLLSSVFMETAKVGKDLAYFKKIYKTLKLCINLSLTILNCSDDYLALFGTNDTY